MFNPSSYNISEMADEAEDILIAIDNDRFTFNPDELDAIQVCLEYVVHQASKREARRERFKANAKASKAQG